MDVRRLLLPLALVLTACAAPPEPDIGLIYDRYVMPAEVNLLDPPTREERRRAELDWPPVQKLALPWRTDVRRVNTSVVRGVTRQRRLSLGLPPCGTPRVETGPCRGVPDAPPPPPVLLRGAPVLLRADDSGYGAPRLRIQGQ